MNAPISTLIPVIPWDGEPISKPGIYSGIPMDDYHGQLTVGPSISSSGLRDIFYKSPRAFYRTSYLNPARKPKKPSEPFIFGRAAHHLLLGESNFQKFFAIRPEEYPDGCGKPWNSNANACKAWLAEMALAKRIVLTTRDIEIVRAMALSLAEEPLIQQGALNGLIEHSFVWQDEETGVWVKWRPDAIPTTDLNFSDLKTCTDVSDEALERSITDYGYHCQAALGAWACDTVLGREMSGFSLVFVEKEDTLPCVRVKTVRPVDVELGARQNRVALRTFARCVERGEWLGPGGAQHDAEYSGVSDWAYKKIERRIADLEGQMA